MSKSFKGETLVGKTFERWTVLEFFPCENKHQYWLCKCSCNKGIIKEIRADKLKSGLSKSCGCFSVDTNKARTIDLIGQTFGRLTVIERAEAPKDRPQDETWWECICSCNNKKYYTTSKSLRNAGTQSCGCLQKEKASINAKKNINDLTGQIFGKLTVLEITDKRVWENVVWKCQCNCNKKTIKYIPGNYLISGRTQSCGCIKSSIGETNIKDILNKNNIKYISEYTFPNLKSKYNQYLRFDFAVFINEKLSYLIEYDGEQHTRSLFGQSLEDFSELIERDMLKNKYCKENNIPLIRIPYTERDKITLELLQLETTPYLIK